MIFLNPNNYLMKRKLMMMILKKMRKFNKIDNEEEENFIFNNEDISNKICDIIEKKIEYNIFLIF